MDLSKKVLVVINVRLKSSRIYNKALAPFCGSSLFEIAVRKLVSSKVIPESDILICYDKEFRHDFEKSFDDNFVKEHPNLNIYLRSKESCIEETDASKIYEFTTYYGNIHNYDSFMLVNICCPLLNIQTIDAFYSRLKYEDKGGLFGVIKKKNYIWDGSQNPINLPIKEGAVMNTKSSECLIYEAAHCLYGSKIEYIDENRFMGGFTKAGPALFIIPENETFDIDYPWQFYYGEILYKGLNV